jgi:hypothetical protein
MSDACRFGRDRDDESDRCATHEVRLERHDDGSGYVIDQPCAPVLCETALARVTELVASLRSEAAEAHSEEAWGFEPMAKVKNDVADRIDVALRGEEP